MMHDTKSTKTVIRARHRINFSTGFRWALGLRMYKHSRVDVL